MFSNFTVDILICNLNDLHCLEGILFEPPYEIVAIINFTHHLSLCEEIQPRWNVAMESGQLDFVCLISHSVSQPFQLGDLYSK